VGVLARMFEDHLCVIERNNHGHTVIAYVKEDPAVNLYRRQVKDKVTDKADLVIGWDTNKKSKGYAINTLAQDLEDGECVPQSPDTYDELCTYVFGDRGIMAATQGKKDGRVIALATQAWTFEKSARVRASSCSRRTISSSTWSLLKRLARSSASRVTVGTVEYQ
jgi:hypothetical protein